MKWKKYLTISIICMSIIAITIKIYTHYYFFNLKDNITFDNVAKIDTNMSNFTFDILGDNKNSITTFNKIIKLINNDNSKFVINGGDIVFDGSEAKYTFFLKQISKLKKPMLYSIGNHEIADNGRGRYYKIFDKFYYSFHTKNSYFIFLDDANENYIDKWQMKWLHKELEKSKNYKYKFIVMHVPLFDPRSKIQPGHSLKNVTQAKYLNKLFDNYNITMIFASHIHAYYEGKWGNTPYIITGGAGAELAGTDKAHYFYHYLKVHVSEKGINYELVKLHSPDYNIFDRVFWSLWIYLYAFISINAWSIIVVLGLIYILIIFIFSKKFKTFKEFTSLFHWKKK
ncbi:calcineurin-like phosphoesterase family protein [Hypnocyclicus thermotrophus]|uniref:Calcineurin-like phosphoesterase family protein n=1 Tax=Hypnocyclicus thermotrophus TaxID=1627895 RepID=A0AA46DZR3_9FUSO|nr:metallophosphoesterase [Hypnocyclicus thermotrophus]TDT71957.1 calcineurin-like phosphoesterase family protein [Hypnocyclicus thermotrophus]